ncbi:MAG TPA: hypothetical protein VM261_37350 [Kofleriaceae bacterium]|nr:hypothetical protein [Kofleriaceae bacterium]
MRRRTKPEGSLTSLLDVLFIIVFASLVQSSARGEARVAEAEEAALAKAQATKASPGPVVPAAPAELVALRDAAVSVTTTRMKSAPMVAVRIDADGSIVDVEWAGEKHALGLPLLERVADPDIAVAYLGDRAPALRVCGVVAHELRVAELPGYVVVISPAVALAEMSVALVAGLRRDVARCQSEQQGMAIIVEPGMISPQPQPQPAVSRDGGAQ